uniref:Uncharacterized protein n=1 Tax=uncultured prokaryote TaxID=198431 RepID=H5SCM4_9ZZZZ|nr:hypothetical protein HGMM_F11C09C18 [uncultured prokaryote]
MLDTEGLIAELNAHGYHLNRWRVMDWIRKGLLPHPTRHGRGRGHGVVFVWEDGERTFKQALRVAQALAWNRRLSNAIVPLWVMGYDMPLDRVRKTLLEWYDVPATLHKIQARYAQPRDELADAISHMAVRGQQAGFLRWLKESDTHTREEAAEVLLSVFHRPKYRPIAVLLKRIARATGFEPDTLKTLLPYLSRPTLAQALAQADDSDYLWARDVLHQCIELAQRVDPERWQTLKTTFEDGPHLLFNLAANAGAWAIPVLVKLRLDGHAALVEELLAYFWEELRERSRHKLEHT